MKYDNPFQFLVAVMLSARSTDDMVNKVTSRLFERFKRPEDFAGLDPDWLAEEIRGCGLYRNKSRHIVETSRILVEKYGSRVPETRADLESLPGVGRKTANVILSVIFGKPAMPVDTHVFRVARRLGLARGKTPAAVEREITDLVKPERLGTLHHQLIAHGRKVCTARNPHCDRCRLADFCPSAPVGHRAQKEKS